MPPQEDSNLCGVSTSAYVYNDARAIGSEIIDASTYLGNNVFDIYVSIKKRHNSEVQNLGHRLIGNNYSKSVWIFDDDINIHDYNEILWAYQTRCQPNRDIVITGNMMHGASLDPSSPLFRSTSKIFYDCTIPIGNTKEETEYNQRRHAKVRVPFSNDVSW